MLNIIRTSLFTPAGIVGVLLLASLGSGTNAYAACLDGGYALDVETILDVVPHPTEPDTLFVIQNPISVDGVSLLKSCDGGTTWSPTALTADFYTVIRLAVDPINPETVYAATTRGHVVSIDGGITWSETDIPGFSLVFAEDGTLYSYDINRIWRRLPGDTAWTEMAPAPSRFDVLRVHPADSARLHVGQYYSVDGGASWQRVLPDIVRDLRYSKTDPERMIATAMPILLSDDGGVNWYEPTYQEFESFSYSPREGTHVAFGAADSDTLWVATRWCGIWRSDSGGARWRLPDEGLSGGPEDCRLGTGTPQIDRFEPSPTVPGRFFAVTVDGLFITDNAGELWTSINGVAAEVPPAPPPNPYSGSADMTLDLFGLGGSYSPPTTLRFSGTVRNNGPDTARDVTLSLPANVVSTTWGTCNGGSCDFGDVPPGTTIALEFERELLGGGGPQCSGDVFEISSGVSAATNDPNPGNNSDTVSSVRRNGPTLISGCSGEGLLKKASDNSAESGGGAAGGLLLWGLLTVLLARGRRIRERRDCQKSRLGR